MLEQREHVRYSIEGSANIKPEDGTAQAINTELIDICYKGIGVRANEKIETGACVGFKLIIKQFDKPIVGTGRVKYSKEYGAGIFRMGIEFINIDKETIGFVISHIHRKSSAGARKKPPDRHHY